MLPRLGQTHQSKKPKGRNMPKAGGKRRPLVRTQKAKKIGPGVPLLETRARSILSTMVTEVEGEPGARMPEVPPPMVAAPPELEMALEDLTASELAAIAREGASLELDGSKFEAEELAKLARNVTDDAHLKVSNSGTFTAEELGMIARSAHGQVIFA
jgi:hypothetical protein